MAIINYYRLKCDWCGSRSPELLDTEEFPMTWKEDISAGKHFCTQTHYDEYLKTIEKIVDEW